jgi:hypothetical protein
MSNAVRGAVQPARRSVMIFCASLVAIAAGVIACSDSPEKTVAPLAATAAVSDAGNGSNPNAFVGEGHNAMVDAVLRDVAKKRSNGLGQKKLCKLVEESAIEYARTTAKNPGEAVRAVKQVNFCETPTGSAGIRVKTQGKIGEGYDLPQRAIDLLNATDYYTGISYSGAELAGYLAPINSAAVNELGWEDAEIVTSASAVAVSSLDYWTANLGAWQSEFGVQTAYQRVGKGFNDGGVTPYNSFWWDVWDIVKADLIGAVDGGTTAKLMKGAVPQYALYMGASKSLIKLISKL